MLSQIPEGQQAWTLDKQEHEALAFLTAAFRSAGELWSALEKEGYVIVDVMTRMDNLVAGRIVSIFTAHANLVNMYDPYDRSPSVPLHTANKLMR